MKKKKKGWNYPLILNCKQAQNYWLLTALGGDYKNNRGLRNYPRVPSPPHVKAAVSFSYPNEKMKRSYPGHEKRRSGISSMHSRCLVMLR